MEELIKKKLRIFAFVVVVQQNGNKETNVLNIKAWNNFVVAINEIIYQKRNISIYNIL